MNKSEYIEKVAEKAGVAKSVATDVVNASLDVIVEAMKDRDDISIVGYGTFGVKTRPERTARNPSTGESMVLPATPVPYFKAGSKLKEAAKEEPKKGKKKK